MKHINFFIFVVIVGWFSACSSTPQAPKLDYDVFDNSIARHQGALVYFADSIQVKTYNDIDIPEDKRMRGERALGRKLLFPAGDAQINLDLYAFWGDTRFTVKDFTLKYILEAGKEYYFVFKVVRVGRGDNELRILLLAGPKPELGSEELAYWSLGVY